MCSSIILLYDQWLKKRCDSAIVCFMLSLCIFSISYLVYVVRMVLQHFVVVSVASFYFKRAVIWILIILQLLPPLILMLLLLPLFFVFCVSYPPYWCFGFLSLFYFFCFRILFFVSSFLKLCDISYVVFVHCTKDFRRRYNYTVQVHAPNSKRLEVHILFVFTHTLTLMVHISHLIILHGMLLQFQERSQALRNDLWSKSL
jgi:hypothetical protein